MVVCGAGGGAGGEGVEGCGEWEGVCFVDCGEEEKRERREGGGVEGHAR